MTSLFQLHVRSAARSTPATGTIPKTNKVIRSENKWSTSDEVDESDNDDSSIYSDEIFLKKKVAYKPANVPATSPAPVYVSSDRQRIDMRILPPFDQFSESSGLSLVDYLEWFWSILCRKLSKKLKIVEVHIRASPDRETPRTLPIA